MAIITIPGSISKGTTFNVTISRSELANLSVVSADSYFSDVDNWNYVILNYTSGNQSKSVKCQASSGSFLSSSRVRSSFTLQNIIIEDFDGGYFLIRRSDISSPSSYDITFGSSGLQNVNWSINSGFSSTLASYSTDGGLLSTSPGSWSNYAADNTAITGDFTLTYKFTAINSLGVVRLGYGKSAFNLNGSESFANERIYLTGSQVIIYPAGSSIFGNLQIGTQYTFTISRTGSAITYSLTGGTASISNASWESYSGSVYPFAAFFDSATRLDYAKKA